MFAAILAGMLFLSGASLKWLVGMGVLVAAAIPIGFNFLRDYQKDRLLSFLNPGQDLHGSGWQVIQSQIAVGSGGLLGAGLTDGTQNRGSFLPVQESDFVAAVLFEELS